MSTIIAFVLGAVVGLVLPHIGQIKAALTGDPTAKPASKAPGPVQSSPVQAVPPAVQPQKQLQPVADPKAPAANAKG